MRMLAAELGVSAMTPYRYFKDKDEILSAIRARALAALPTSWKARWPSRARRRKTAPQWAAPISASRWRNRPVIG